MFFFIAAFFIIAEVFPRGKGHFFGGIETIVNKKKAKNIIKITTYRLIPC